VSRGRGDKRSYLPLPPNPMGATASSLSKEDVEELQECSHCTCDYRFILHRGRISHTADMGA